MSQKAFEFGAQGVADYVCFKVFYQEVRERAQVPQLVMLCRRWAHLQCFAGRTGRTQAIVLLENAHKTPTSGIFKKI